LVDQVLAQEDLATGDVDWLLADHQGTVRDVVRWDDVADEAELVEHYQYDTFGNLVLIADITGTVISTDRSDAVTRYQYTGRDWDADSGLQYNRARWYDPATGRWISEDPIGFAGGDANLARYVGNGPTYYVDPSGLEVANNGSTYNPYDSFDSSYSPGHDTGGLNVPDDPYQRELFYDALDNLYPNGRKGPVPKTIVRIEKSKGTWDHHDWLVETGAIEPSLGERCWISLSRTAFPSSEPSTTVYYSDGTFEVFLGGGPSSGDLAAQGALIVVVGAAARAGVNALVEEAAEEVFQTAWTELTGLPAIIPRRGGVKDCPTGNAPQGTGARFGDNAKLQDHFNRHGGDFGATSARQYDTMADGFLTGPRQSGVLEKIRPNGDVVRFNPTTDEFGVVSGNGIVRTYYKPDPAVHGHATNLDYFNAQ
jgi:RHS repeat-associated protein